MTEPIRPVLTAENVYMGVGTDQWNAVVERAVNDNGRRDVALIITTRVEPRVAIYVARDKMHAIAALALHGQPFGFTRDDVRDCLDAGDAATCGKAYPDDLWRRMNNLAARIEALLPPEAK